MAELTRIIAAVDAHTAGEPARLVLSGLPPIPGATMADKKGYFSQHLDFIRTLLLHEPRGHRDMFGILLTAPVSTQADYGILFMDSAGYIDMCGHSVMAAATVLIELGIVMAQEPITTIVFDTPAGRVESRAQVMGNNVVEVTIANVPAFVYQREVEIQVPERDTLRLDIAFGGNFFALVPAERLGLSITPVHYAQLVQWGMAIKAAVNQQIPVQHPLQPHIAQVELTEIYETSLSPAPASKNLVIFGQGQVDRCPCGTGTSAAMALLHSRGELPLGIDFSSESLIGTRFRGKLVAEKPVEGWVMVDPLMTGASYLTGLQQFVVDPRDPLKHGFMIGPS